MLSGSQVTFLLILYLSEWVRAASVGPSLLQPPMRRVRIIEVGDDYDDASSVTTLAPQSPGATTTSAIPRICDYDPCVVQMTPCSEISAQTGCLCRGVTGGEVRPEAPKLREIKVEHSGQVVVHWCAPRSTVMHYKVTLKSGEGQEQIFEEYLRNSVVAGMKVGETVCVSAMNEAGVSEESCAQYESPMTNHYGLSAGIIAGGVGFLVLITLLAVLLWRRRSCRKANMSEAGGLGNPSYTNDAVL